MQRLRGHIKFTKSVMMPQSFYWHPYSAARQRLVLLWRTESLKEGDMKQAGDGHGRTERVKLK